MAMLLLAASAFVGTHFLLSHPLRAPLVRVLGEGGFLGLYSLVAALTLGWTVWATARAPVTAPLWAVGDGLWAVATGLMLLASCLLVGSLRGNPAFPNPSTDAGSAAVPGPARDVYAITRHPMLWAFALWGISHILVYPLAKTLVVAGAIVGLALVGAAFQDRKKERLQPARWPAWERQTSYFPFAAVAAGRARLQGFGPATLVGGPLLWLLATWAHLPLAGWPAGIWRWVVRG